MKSWAVRKMHNICIGALRLWRMNSYYGQRAREAETSLGKSANASPIAVPGIDFDQVIASV